MHNHTQTIYFKTDKDVLRDNNLFFTSTQLLTWAVVAVIWTADEGAHIGYLLFGFLGAMAASFVLWVPSRNVINITSNYTRRTIPLAYVLSAIAAFFCILHLRPCLDDDDDAIATSSSFHPLSSMNCTVDAGFGSFLPGFRYYLHGLHILLLLPIFISRLLPIKQPQIDTAVLYACLTFIFSTWHIFQLYSRGSTFAVPATDCQKSITTDLIFCSAITLYAIYHDNVLYGIGSARRLTLLAMFMIPIFSPAAVLSAHLCSCRFRASHIEAVSSIQRHIARKMQNDNSDTTTDDQWCNLGLWNVTKNPVQVDYDKACESLALALAQSAKLCSTDTVLCCGCGSGKEMHLYKNRFRVRHITGIDPYVVDDKFSRNDSASILRQSEDFNIRKIRANVEELGNETTALFPKRFFNTVLALDNVYHYPDKVSFFKDSANLLPVGGKVAVTDIILRCNDKNGSTEKIPLWVKGALYAMGVTNAWTEHEYHAHLVTSAGFADIKIERIGERVFHGWKHVFPSSLLKYIDYAIIVATKPASATGGKNEINAEAISAKPKKIAIIGSGMAGLAAAHSIYSSSKAADVSVDIYESNAKLGLAGQTSLLGRQLIDVPPRMATIGYYKNYVQLLNDLRIPLSIVKTDCAYQIEGRDGKRKSQSYEKSDLANLYNIIFVCGPMNLWRLMKAMSEVNNKWGRETLKNHKKCAAFSFGDWLHKHFNLQHARKDVSTKQNSDFDVETLASHENPFLLVMIGSLGWMLS
eukprot:12795144-Ditylum_brightwellii.AAC.1